MRQKIAPVLLILLGVGELIIGFAGVIPPLPIFLILGVLFIGWGVKLLMAERKK